MKKYEERAFNRRTIALTAQDENWQLVAHSKANYYLVYHRDEHEIKIYYKSRTTFVGRIESEIDPRCFEKAGWTTIARLFEDPNCSTAFALHPGPCHTFKEGAAV